MRYQLDPGRRDRQQTPSTIMAAARPIQVLSQDDTDAILAAARDSTSATARRDFTLIETALLTGLRPGEVVALTVWHIAPFGTVTDELEVTKTIAKGAQPRTIPIHPDLQTDLQTFLTWKERMNQDISPSAPLFISRKSTKHLTVRAFQMILKDLSVKALGKSVNPHRLRHTFATRALQHANLRTVQDLLGHASVANTQLYTHPTTEDLRNAVNSLKP